MYNDQFGEFVALNITIIFYLNPFERTPRMGPESRSCTFPLGRPVSRKADKYYSAYSVFGWSRWLALFLSGNNGNKRGKAKYSLNT